jgi:hypothetical protein
MTGNKILKQFFLGGLAAASFITILLGIQAIVNKANGIIFIGCGVLLFIGAIIIAKIMDV